MKFLSDFFPVLLFFLVYFLGQRNADTALGIANQYLSGLTRDGVIPPDTASLMLATAVAVTVLGLQILVLLLRRKPVGMAQWLSFLIFLVFGGATIYFHNATFIKWKPTVLYWVFGLVLFISQRFFKTNLICKLMGANGLQLPQPIWNQLNLAWVIFFAFVGALNLYIAFNFSNDVWVSFKAFGMTVLTLVFALAMGLYLARHIKDDPAEASASDSTPSK